MSDSFSEAKGFVKGLVWGILIAMAFVFFLEKTEKGKTLKEKIKDKGGDLLDDLPGLLDKLEEKGEELVEEAGRIENEIKENKEELKEDLTAIAEKKLGASLSHIEVLQEHGREITQGIKRHLFKGIPKKSKASIN